MALTGWGTANYLERAAGVGTQPILVSAWGYHKASGTQGRAVEIGWISGNANPNQHRRTLQIDGAATPQAIQHSTSSVTGIATATAAPSVDTWFQMSGWFLTNTSREISWDNGNLGTNSTNKAPSAPDTTRIGLGCGGVGDWAAAGGLAEISIWDATGFTATDRRALDAKLAAGDNPLAIDAEAGQVWTGKLLAYWRLEDASDLSDLSGNGHDMTMVGTLTTFASHPPVDAVPGGGVTLTVADATHGHTAESFALTQQNTLAVADAAHAHAAESPSPSVAFTIAPADALHAHAAESPALTLPGALQVADAVHGHTADNLTLTQAAQLAVQEALHAHTADSPALSVAFLLAVADALHAHYAENPVLAEAALIAVQDALHAHRADHVAIFLPDDPSTIYRGARILRGAGSVRVLLNPASEGARVLRPTVRIREMN